MFGIQNLASISDPSEKKISNTHLLFEVRHCQAAASSKRCSAKRMIYNFVKLSPPNNHHDSHKISVAT